MANLRILIPEATANYVTNPSIRYDTTGWNLVGSTISRTQDYARFGTSSLKVVTNGSVVGEGAYYRVSSLSGVGDPVTASVYVRGQGKVRLRLIVNPTGQEHYSKTITLSLDKWTRIEATCTAIGSNDIRLYVETMVAKAVTFYVDGAQLERKAYSTTYCDGDQPGCKWNLTGNESVSTRDGLSREGGKWIALAGPCRGNDDLYVTVMGGFGMPAITNNTQSWANAPGSFFQNIKVLDRVVTLSFFVKNKNLRLIGAPKLNKLHELRQQLLDIIKPDRTASGEAFLFEYDDGERPLYMRFRYVAGLEGEWDLRNPWVNSFPIRLTALDPFWYEDNQNVSNLNFLNSITYASAVQKNAWQRLGGAWYGMPNPPTTNYLNGGVWCLAWSPKGDIYAGGQFSSFGFAGIARWDGVQFNPLSNGLMGPANSYIKSIAFSPDGTLYVTGSFATIGGVAAANVAKYNPATNTWSALSTGLNNVGNAICVAPNGQVYIGGLFTTAGGVTVNYICRWDGLQFRTVGAPTGLNNQVRALVNAGDGRRIWMGGDFTAASSGSAGYLRLAYIDITNNLIYTPSGTISARGVNAAVYALAVGKDGTLYFGGGFTTDNGSLPVKMVGYFLGGVTHQVGDGLTAGTINPIVYGLSIAPDGTLYAVGDFTLSGNTPVPKMARYFKGAWNALDIITNKFDTTGPSKVYSILVHPNGDVYMGGQDALANAYFSGITNVVNTGSAEVQPIIYIVGPGKLRFIENWTTKKKIYINLDILPSEEVFIDFSKALIYSTIRGNLYGYILSGSDFRAFSLSPGNNQIAAFMTDDVGATMKISYVPQHWSADSVVDAEELS